MNIPFKGRIGGAVFDMDGLLFDTERLAFNALKQVAAEWGYSLSWADYLRLVCIPEHEERRILRSLWGDDSPIGEIRKQQEGILNEAAEGDGPPVKSGVRELLALLSSVGIPTGVATQSPSARAKAYVEAAGLREAFRVVIGGDEVERRKPAPDLYLRAASLLGVSPKELLVFEDSESGVQAGLSAGCQVVVVPDLAEPPPEVTAQVLARVPSLIDIITPLREYFGAVCGT